MSEWLIAGLMFLGGLLMLLAAVGVARLPDLFMRMQAATKASALGAGLMVLAVAIFFGDVGTVMRAVLVIAFIFLTAPVSAHLIGRAAYFVGVPLWEGTVIDELRDHYDLRTHALTSAADPVAPREPASNS
jgi:multicomponent Na+:H+ antiporter subunit G